MCQWRTSVTPERRSNQIFLWTYWSAGDAERRSETWIHTHLSTLTHTHCYWRLNRCWCVSAEDKRYTWETIRNMNTHSSVHTNTHSLLLKTEQMLMCVSGGQALETPERRSETWIHTHLSTLTHTHCYWRLNRCWCVSVEDKRYTWETIRNMNTHSSVHTNTHSQPLVSESNKRLASSFITT